MRVYVCFACCEGRHGECDAFPCQCDCEIASGPDTRDAQAIRILRRVYAYLNCIRGMAFVGVEHPSQIQAIIGTFLDEEKEL
jgi:hypothetical protein